MWFRKKPLALTMFPSPRTGHYCCRCRCGCRCRSCTTVCCSFRVESPSFLILFLHPVVVSYLVYRRSCPNYNYCKSTPRVPRFSRVYSTSASYAFYAMPCFLCHVIYAMLCFVCLLFVAFILSCCAGHRGRHPAGVLVSRDGAIGHRTTPGRGRR